jgi:hypothetical protein
MFPPQNPVPVLSTLSLLPQCSPGPNPLAFMYDYRRPSCIFRKAYETQVALYILDGRSVVPYEHEINAAASALWKGLSEIDKKPWEHLADVDHEKHQALYPNLFPVGSRRLQSVSVQHCPDQHHLNVCLHPSVRPASARTSTPSFSSQQVSSGPRGTLISYKHPIGFSSNLPRTAPTPTSRVLSSLRQAGSSGPITTYEIFQHAYTTQILEPMDVDLDFYSNEIGLVANHLWATLDAGQKQLWMNLSMGIPSVQAPVPIPVHSSLPSVSPSPDCMALDELCQLQLDGKTTAYDLFYRSYVVQILRPRRMNLTSRHEEIIHMGAYLWEKLTEEERKPWTLISRSLKEKRRKSRCSRSDSQDTGLSEGWATQAPRPRVSVQAANVPTGSQNWLEQHVPPGYYDQYGFHS